jgi:uncharacterized membrane protein YcaP (DUF421 family)
MLHTILNFDWHSFLMGEEDWEFLLQVGIRSVIMFVVALISLRIMGKRAIMQGIFEVALIISLGSAAGDAMFYSKVGILPTILVFTIIVSFYLLINFLMARSRYFEQMVEGHTFRVVKEGEMEIKPLKKDHITRDEIFADLRLEGVTHLGQVQNAYIEYTGKISIFFYNDDNVKYGLPILPEMLEHTHSSILSEGYYSCSYCGHSAYANAPAPYQCMRCGHPHCIKSINDKRVK